MTFEEHEVVISGIAGKFADCMTVDELKEKLFSKSNLLKPDEKRWIPLDGFTTPFSTGKLPEWNKFDNTFFGITSAMVRNTDPLLGMMVERSFESMVDAGVNPYMLKGHNICVIATPSFSDSENLQMTEGVEGAGMVGNSRTMMANRISYCFNFIGPSFSSDCSWVSAISALEKAVLLVSQGTVEAAIVTSACHTQYPSVDMEYSAMGMLAQDGMCKPFDAQAHGFARSEAAVSLFIQRAKDAKRIYGSVLKVQTKFVGDKVCSYIRIDPQIEKFFINFYKDVRVNPKNVSYVEAHGTCIKETDAQELNALANVFCHQKSSEQLIGSATGNIGHSESTSGFVSLIKVIIAMEGGVIPPTINYHSPNSDVPFLIAGKLKPVTEPTELPGDLVAVNSLSCYGAFGHVLLRRHEKTKKKLSSERLLEDELPRLALLQARHEEGANEICEKMYAMPLDIEFISMVNDVFKIQVPAYLWRGYTILPTPGDNEAIKIQAINQTKRPLWFIFSGMGSQWTSMGKDLLKIPVFASAIEKCDKVLRPRGLDIKHILSTQDPHTFDSVLHSFVGITAIQIGLVDILRALGITPDGVIGHSVGELGCAYADGCFTAEETLLAAYARGRASLESLDNDYVKGMMAAVGLGYNDIKHQLPPSIDVACHNSIDSCTLSGPTDDIVNFVNSLKNNGIFAKPVSAGGIAYHSRYIKTIAPKLLQYLKEVITESRPRSSKWISSSVPEAEWNTDVAKMCSPEYHTNNLLNPVYFEEACRHLPDNALLLEVAPHGLLQAILRRSIGSQSTVLSMTSRTAENNIYYLLNSLGQLYLNSVDMEINALYPPPQYPVSRCTPSLANLVTWDHREDQYTELLSRIEMHYKRGSLEKTVNPTVPEYQYWKDHCIGGEVVVPLMQILMYPWDMVLNSQRQKIEQHYTVIEGVTIRGTVVVDETEKVVVSMYSQSSLSFEVDYVTKGVNTQTNIVRGRLYHIPAFPIMLPESSGKPSDMEEVSENEIYSILIELGCELGPQFQTIKHLHIGNKECIAKILWNGNLITFLDSMIKFVMILKSRQKQTLLYPISFIKFIIDEPYLTNLPLDTEVKVHYQPVSNRLVCQGAELLGLFLSPIALKKLPALSWSELKFQPYFDDKQSVEEFLSVSVQIAAEGDFSTWKGKSSEVFLSVLIIKTEDRTSAQFTQIMKNSFRSHTNIKLRISELDLGEAKEILISQKRLSHLVLGEYNSLISLVKHSSDKFFCITYLSNNGTPKYDNSLKHILTHQSESRKIALLKKVTTQGVRDVRVYKIETPGWLSDIRHLVKEDDSEHPILVVTRNLSPRQVLPLLVKEPYSHRVRSVFITDRDAPNFSLTSPLYSTQLSLGLSVNVLSGGRWGSLRTVSLNVNSCNFSLESLITSSNPNLMINCVGLNTTTFTLEDDSTPEEPVLKFLDYSGIETGQRVMGIAYFDSDSNSLSPDPTLKWPVPTEWTMDDAATVPVAYTLAYYCVYLKAKLSTGENLLILPGLSPLGQAVISVALQAEANVFVAITSGEEAITLSKIFPKLKQSHLFVLGKENLDVSVKKVTGGKGVDIIVNCLSGRDMHSSIKLMTYETRFLHLGHIRIEDRESIGMSNFFNMTSFHGITLNNLLNCREDGKTELRKALKSGINRGIVTPLNRRTFRPREITEAIQNLRKRSAKEKTVLISKFEDKILPLNGYFHCNSNHLQIIAGVNAELKLALADWLIRHGAKKLIILSDEDDRSGDFMKKINRLVYRKKCSTVITSSSRLDSIESALEFLKDVCHIGTVSSIFCVCMSENSNEMKNLDSASRQCLPGLQQFVSLLGNGSEVCESRAGSGLVVCSIQSGSSLKKPANIIPYLSNLLSDNQTKSKFFVVDDKISTTAVQGNLDCDSFFPKSLEELYTQGSCVELRLSFTEEVTRSPGYEVVKYCLLPVFVVSGLGKHSLEPLLRHLMHPAFCCSLPVAVESVEQFAESLLENVVKIQKRGPFNIVGVSWNGAVALELGRLLEARGDQVNLILIEGIPTNAQDRLKALCEKDETDMGTCLLNTVFPPQNKEMTNHSQLNWDEKVQQHLQHVEPTWRKTVALALNSLYSQISALMRFHPSKQLFKGNVTLITNKGSLLEDLKNLSKFCSQSPKTVTIEDNKDCPLITNYATATAINENLAFDWKL